MSLMSSDTSGWQTGFLPRRLLDGMMRVLRQTRSATPTVLQMEGLECGAASLAMILAHYGRWIPLERLREACGVSRDGSKASNVLKAARRFGMAAKGFRKEPSTLNELPLPAIIHWNFNHFVVLERVGRDHAYINDPAVGRRRVDHEEFEAAFTGVVLAMEPGAEFAQGGRKPEFLPLLLRRLGHSMPAVGLLVAISVALAVPIILIPTFAKIFIDDILIQHNLQWFTPLLIGMAIAALTRTAMTAFQQSPAVEAADQAHGWDGVRLSLARADVADGILHAASRRRHRKPRRRQ
jgi:ABC-type bacteriocin/lantibiotic exporter with double-glycine peptidase domain